jgi:ubiquinone/menaquinone biosynthesis C-methylase UbiE
MNESGVPQSRNRYQQAHFSDGAGYQLHNHNFSREDVILQMYEYMQIFRKSFSLVGWNSRDLSSKKILEIGTAWGLRLNQLLGFNLSPANMFGIDIQEEYIQQARQLNPSMTFEVMSATEIQYPDKHFDCSFACVAMQAMMDDAIITQSLSEMCRVSREFILVVDIFDPKYSDERNGTVYLKGVDIKHIEELAGTEVVDKVNLVGSFWTTSTAAWRIFRFLSKIGFSTIFSYALAINHLTKHSHKAFLIKLKSGMKTKAI